MGPSTSMRSKVSTPQTTDYDVSPVGPLVEVV